MQKYAKINSNGTLEYAPRDIVGISNWIEDEAAVLAAGYLPIVKMETPEGQYVSGYKSQNGQIIPVFSLMPEPTYQELRRRSYPPMEEQLDMLYWDKVNGTDNWQQTIAEVKAAYPKPTQTEDENA